MRNKHKETVEEMIKYRQVMPVVEKVVWQNNCAYPICPRCDCSFERDYQSFCDRCGQRLGWRGYGKATLRYVGDSFSL
jgi:hypothetical protein